MKLKETVEMMNSADYKERFKAEVYQLENRINGLTRMLIKYKNGKYRIIDFKTKRVNDSGIWKLEGKTLEQYEQQVKIYQRFLEDMNPEMKGQFDTPLLATFATEY